ncbi:MAG: VOC family protein [Candidatus Micrarchaeaceae archaeon]|jgi:predicted 3-demethylubiquinone-9 3-methyltransferase (glyoxalase superfamily)
MQKITPFLWFVKDADKAAKFYVSIFGKDSKIIAKQKLENTPSGPNAFIIVLKLNGLVFNFINGGNNPGFDKFYPSTSFVINCKNQREVDYYWNSLIKEGKVYACGWLADKFGVTWQVVPIEIDKYLGGPDAKGRARAMKAMLEMKKLDIGVLKRAYKGK